MDLHELKQFATTRQCEIIDAIIKHGSQAKAAKALGINSRSLERMLKRVKQSASRQGWSPDHDMIHIAPDTHLVKGVSTFYDENGNPIRQWVKTDLKKEDQAAALKAFAEGLIQELPKYVRTPQTIAHSVHNQLTAYAIGDAHIGMWVNSSRNRAAGDWNLEIAERVTLEAIEKLINAGGFSHTGMLVDVGDFMHANNAAGTTVGGTPVETDGHFGEAVAAAVRVYRHAINLMLDAHNEVILMMTRGNHNGDVAIVINEMLKVFYENEPRVKVLDNANKFMSYQFDKVLITSHHGDRIKPQSVYEYFTRAMPKAWGETDHRYCLMGHIHHQTAKEIGGMVFESFNTLAAPDGWHSDSGYGAKRSMTCIVFDGKHGEIQRHKVGINQLKGASCSDSAKLL
jgi:hypothetical protein